jgi:hypothetical protein
MYLPYMHVVPLHFDFPSQAKKDWGGNSPPLFFPQNFGAILSAAEQRHCSSDVQGTMI